MRRFLVLSAVALGLACSDPAEEEAECTVCGDASPEPACASCDGACEEALTVGPPNHLGGDIDYADEPPAGGAHNDCWADWGFHEEPVRPENWVHNLEHGGVVFLHNCPDGCDGELDELRALAAARPRTLVTEYTRMEARFAVVAWGHRLLLSCYDADALAAFYDRHFDHGLESVSAGPPSGC